MLILRDPPRQLGALRLLPRAGRGIAEGATSGMNMHRGRHTAATELQRAQHDLRLTQLLLGHSDIRSTARYAQLDTADLAEALREMQGGAD
jgi:site-specific recombinase XerC